MVGMHTPQTSGFVELIIRPCSRGRRRREASVCLTLAGGHRLRVEGRSDPQVVRAVVEAVLGVGRLC